MVQQSKTITLPRNSGEVPTNLTQLHLPITYAGGVSGVILAGERMAQLISHFRWCAKTMALCSVLVLLLTALAQVEYFFGKIPWLNR